MLSLGRLFHLVHSWEVDGFWWCVAARWDTQLDVAGLVNRREIQISKES